MQIKGLTGKPIIFIALTLCCQQRALSTLQLLTHGAATVPVSSKTTMFSQWCQWLVTDPDHTVWLWWCPYPQASSRWDACTVALLLTSCETRTRNMVEIFSQPIQTATWMPLLSHWLTVSLTHLHCDIKITGWAGIFKNICTIYVIEVYICTTDSYSWYYSRSMRWITHFCGQKFWTNSAFFILQREHARKSIISLKKSRIKWNEIKHYQSILKCHQTVYMLPQ